MFVLVGNEIWDRDIILHDVLYDTHPTLTDGRPGAVAVECPECGKSELWHISETVPEGHGRCRNRWTRCECDEWVRELPRAVELFSLNLTPHDAYARDKIVEAIMNQFDDPKYKVVYESWNEITVYQIEQRKET